MKASFRTVAIERLVWGGMKKRMPPRDPKLRAEWTNMRDGTVEPARQADRLPDGDGDRQDHRLDGG